MRELATLADQLPDDLRRVFDTGVGLQRSVIDGIFGILSPVTGSSRSAARGDVWPTAPPQSIQTPRRSSGR